MKRRNENERRNSSRSRRPFYAAMLWLLWALGVGLQVVGVAYKPGFSLRFWAACRLASLSGSARL